MPYYRLCFAEAKRAGCFDEFQAQDDAAALREAERHFETGHADLWCGERRVARLLASGRRASAATIRAATHHDRGRGGAAQAC